MIDQPTIQKIFDAADIVEVINDFVNLKKAGQNYRGYSPFTNERTPSFFVSPAKGIYKCFSTGKGGNSVSFLMEHEKLTYPEALKILAKKYNIEIVEKELTAEQIQANNERESLLLINSAAQKYFSDTLLNTDEGKAIGLSYFKERGFTNQTIEKFQLGYSPEKFDAFTVFARDKGFKSEFLVKTGLTIKKETREFDRFHGRVMFPIHSISGQVLGFGGRVMKADDKMAKYLNSPESEVYHKSNILYGLYFAKQSIVKHNRCFLVEGYTDVLSMHQNGIENVVASSGTALTVEQIRLIKRFTPNVTIIYDGDPAGIKASLRGIDLVLEEGMNVKVLLLPEGEDPDSFAQNHSATEFIEFIEANERDFISFKTNLLLKDAQKDPVKRANLITDIVRSIAVIPDGITRMVFIRDCARSLDVKEDILYEEVHKIRSNKASTRAKQEFYDRKKRETQAPVQQQVVVTHKSKASVCEEKLIEYILQFGNSDLFVTIDDETRTEKKLSVVQYIIQEIEKDELTFENGIYQMMYSESKDIIENNGTIEINYFTNHTNESVAKYAVDFVTPQHELSKIWSRNENFLETDDMRLKEIVPKAIIELKKSKIDQMIEDNKKAIDAAHKTNNPEILNEAIQKHQVLNQIRMELYKKSGSIM